MVCHKYAAKASVIMSMIWHFSLSRYMLLLQKSHRCCCEEWGDWTFKKYINAQITRCGSKWDITVGKRATQLTLMMKEAASKTMAGNMGCLSFSCE